MLFVLVSSGLVASGALAQNASDGGGSAVPGLELGLWAGVVEPNRPEEVLEIGFDVTFPKDLLWGIRPQIGALVTEDDAYYGFAGFRYTLPMQSQRFRIDLSTAAGYYENGKGVDLGHELEFRSGLDFMVGLPRGDYLSLAIYHTSNASISSVNPGSDTVLLRYVLKRSKNR